jgi:hypothetical protein
MSSSLVVPYLLLVSFLTPVMDNPEIVKTRLLNNSPFQGVAVMLRDAYDTRQIRYQDYSQSMRLIRRECRKDIWPWVFFNRFLGYEEGTESHPSIQGQRFAIPFKSIKGMDLFNEAGALGDFLHVWKTSLQVSKELGSPGIIVDPEAYNNYKSLRVEYVAEQTGKSAEEVRIRLEEIGKELADIVNDTHPGATIWLLSSSLGRTHEASSSKNPPYRATCTYIIIGMLERSKEKGMQIQFVCGGQESLGYCHKTMADLNEKMKKREERLSPFLKKYDNLHLSGTLAPWDKVESKQGYFVQDSECRASEFKTIADFKPVLTTLFSTYNYNWMYAGSSQWNPYDRVVSMKLLKKFRAELRSEESKSILMTCRQDNHACMQCSL